MQNDVATESVATAPVAYMQVVGIVQALAVGLLLQEAKFFRLLTADHIDFVSGDFWLSFFQATIAFQLIVLTWHVNIQNVIVFKRAFGMWDSYIPFSFVFAEYFLVRNSAPEKFAQWEIYLALFLVGAIAAYTHVFRVSRREPERNKAVFNLIGGFPFWIRAYLAGIVLIVLAGLSMNLGQISSQLVLAGSVDALILAFTFANTRFFWMRIVNTPDLRRG